MIWLKIFGSDMKLRKKLLEKRHHFQKVKLGNRNLFVLFSLLTATTHTRTECRGTGQLYYCLKESDQFISLGMFGGFVFKFLLV